AAGSPWRDRFLSGATDDQAGTATVRSAKAPAQGAEKRPSPRRCPALQDLPGALPDRHPRPARSRTLSQGLRAAGCRAQRLPFVREGAGAGHATGRATAATAAASLSAALPLSATIAN